MDHAVETDRATRIRAPVHLWIVGLLALLWNAFGCYDYLMTRMRNTEYFESMMPTVDPNAALAWIDAFPIWAQFGWGLGVWGGLSGSLLLLMRSRWAVLALGLSLIGALLGLGYQALAAPPLEGMEGGAATVMPYVIIGVALALFLYARAMRGRGVLR
jgi:hypothetical protein